MTKTRISLVLLIVTILVSSLFVLGFTDEGDDEIEKRERELEEINNQIKVLEEDIKLNESEQKTVLGRIEITQTNILGLEREIQDLNVKISDTEKAIVVTDQQLNASIKELDEKNELLEKRVRIMYEMGQVGLVEVLLDSKDLTDLLTRMDMVQKIALHDRNLINELKDQKAVVEQNKLSLENYRSELLSFSNEKNNKLTDLQVASNQLSSQKKELEQDKKALEAAEDRLVKTANQVTEIIKNLESAAQYVGGVMQWPAGNNYTISSYFGYRIHPIYKVNKLHTGIDIPMDYGERVTAAQSGVIKYANWLGSYGKMVMIDHGGGYFTLYAHLSSIDVSVGQQVNRGETVGRCGSTGASTGPHLHFEVRENGEYVDPLNYVKGQ